MPLLALRAIRERKITLALCFCIVGVMCVAAFWPFSFHPANHVSWMSGENGVQFNGSGILLSSQRFQFPNSEVPLGTTLEIWLEPSQERYSNALLSFSSPQNPDQFRLRQSHDFLLIVREPFATSRHTAARGLWVPHAFQAHKRSFIAITSGAQGTTVYLDGNPAVHSFPAFKITSEDLSGQLIVGTSPAVYDTWRGTFLGLALFGSELTAAQVSQHYQAWLNGRPEILKREQPAALYDFAERTGNIAHNQIASEPDLVIPASFRVPYKPFFKSPWKEFYANQAYLLDVLINVAGFVPFGFFFCILLSPSHAGRRAAIATIFLGAAFSFTIELLQGFTPVRDSGTTDIFTNTLGTLLGVMLFRSRALEVLLCRLESRSSRSVGSA